MIAFQKLRWKNLLSTGNIFTEIDLALCGSTLIVGSNGAGKSTILDAITFSLYGKPFRNVNKNQLINSITKKELVVEIEFNTETSEYKIIRGMKPAVFEIYCNGVLMNQLADQRDYQEMLEKTIIKKNYKSFCQTDILGSASWTPFMQLPAAQRRVFIEDLLDLNVFSTMNVLLKEDIQKNNEAIRDNEHQRQMTQSNIKLIKSHYEEIRSKNDDYIINKKKIIVNLMERTGGMDNTRQELSRKLNVLKDKIANADIINEKFNEIYNIRQNMKSKQESLKDEMYFFDCHNECPTCKQEISQEYKTKILDKYSESINEIESEFENVVSAYLKICKKVEYVDQITQEISDVMAEKNQLSIMINSLYDQMTEIEKDIARVRDDSSKMSNDKIIDMEQNLISLNAQYNTFMEDKQVFLAATNLLKDSGIKTKIIERYIPIINSLISKYLAEMELFVDFQLNNQFEETIKSRYRDEFTYASFSEGEKFRINLALLFTWREISKMRNGTNTNLLIMDEVMDSSLDDSGNAEFSKVIMSLTKDTNTFIISHRTDQISDKFDRILNFEKHNNFSRIIS